MDDRTWFKLNPAQREDLVQESLSRLDKLLSGTPLDDVAEVLSLEEVLVIKGTPDVCDRCERRLDSQGKGFIIPQTGEVLCVLCAGDLVDADAARWEPRHQGRIHSS